MTLRTRIALFAIALASIVIFGMTLASAADLNVMTPTERAEYWQHAAKPAAGIKHEPRADRRRQYARRGGKCDGFQRCRCGTTAARKHGLAYNHNGWNLKMAIEWRRFPRTSFQIGAVGVRPHHVLTIVGGSSCASATVYDDAGTYQRNVCNMSFHSVTGASVVASNETYSARPHNRRYRVRHARR